MDRLRKEGAELVYRCAKQRSEPGSDKRGTKVDELHLTPLELIDRIAALVPPPRTHRHRYLGVLAPNSPHRAAVTALATPAQPTKQVVVHADPATTGEGAPGVVPLGQAIPLAPEPAPPKRAPAHYLWAVLIARIYEVFPLLCPLCGGQMRLIAFTTEGVQIRRILDHVGLDSEPPHVSPARGPPLWDACDAQSDDGEHIEPDCDLAAQAAPDYEVDQRILAVDPSGSALLRARPGFLRGLRGLPPGDTRPHSVEMLIRTCYIPMKQQTLAMAADQTYENYRKPTRRDEFLKPMETIVPWAAPCEVIEPYCPKAGNGRPPIGLERMLRIHFIQHWFNLADLACEEALYDSVSLRRFVGIDLGCEPVPDSTTITKFRKLLNDNNLGEALFAQVGKELQARGFKVNTGTIVDATIIGAPSSTKNADKAHDPEMHQTRNGQQWFFGMKLHIGVDSQSGQAHSAVVTAANVHDTHPLPALLHGNERRVYGDSAYASQKKLLANKAAHAQNFTNQRSCYAGIVDVAVRTKNRNKSRILSRVGHAFGVVKQLWGFGKARYRGLQKNATRAFTALALANIYLGRQRLMAQVRP